MEEWRRIVYIVGNIYFIRDDVTTCGPLDLPHTWPTQCSALRSLGAEKSRHVAVIDSKLLDVKNPIYSQSPQEQ